MPSSDSGRANGDLGAERDAAEAQLLRADIGRVEHPRGVALVVTVAGEIDFSTADRFREALTAGLDQLRDGEILVIDLTQVRFMSSTGLQALVDVALAAQGRCEPLPVVVDRTHPVMRPLKTTGLDEFFAVLNTVGEVLRSVNPQRQWLTGEGTRATSDRRRGSC
ncbi:MAG: STAS domain-containing protein [Actinobacteria bacterium]|nr:STAS domain-containing protein [Actinomycetota bacterium]